jgi:hypothetical protein
MRWYFVAAVIVLSAAVAVLAAEDGASDAAQRARLASKRLDDGRIMRITGSETADGACIAVRVSRGVGEFCGLGAPARDELTVAESYGHGVTAFVIYAGNRVSAVRVEMRSGGWKIKRLRRAVGAGDMEWFKPLRFGLLVRKGDVAQPKLVALGRDGKPLKP